MKRNTPWFRLRLLIGRGLTNDRGDVLAEYVILTLFILLPLVGVSLGLINPTGAMFTTDGTVEGENFGIFGNALVAMFRRVMCGLALPIP